MFLKTYEDAKKAYFEQIAPEAREKNRNDQKLGTSLAIGMCLGMGIGVVLGSIIFRLVYTIALRFNMPAFMLKAVSSVIVVLAISLPYLKSQKDTLLRRFGKGGQKKC